MAQNNVHFRRATHDDADRLADIRVQAMRASLEAVGRFDPKRARLRFLDNFQPEYTEVVLCDSECVGFFVVLRREDHLWLDHLYVLPQAQGLGLGTLVVKEVQARARDTGKAIHLMALRDSPANAFYRRHGFRFDRQDAYDCYYTWADSVPPQ